MGVALSNKDLTGSIKRLAYMLHFEQNLTINRTTEIVNTVFANVSNPRRLSARGVKSAAVRMQKELLRDTPF